MIEDHIEWELQICPWCKKSILPSQPCISVLVLRFEKDNSDDPEQISDTYFHDECYKRGEK